MDITHPRIPISTYRLQFNRSFTFHQAHQILAYLHDLGITDIYASPYLKATPGSLHGYDIVDPSQLNPEVGTEQDYQAFIHELHRHGMGQILDVVPNHMGIGKLLNPWWLDVLENGPSSPYASFFDIDWEPIKRELADKVLLPILGDSYGKVLENQEITLHFDAEQGLFFITYYENTLPLGPKPWAQILTYQLDRLALELGTNHPHLEDLRSIITALDHLPSRRASDPKLVEERRREKEIIKRRLATLAQHNATVHQFILDNVTRFNGTKGDPYSFDLLDDLLDDQAYRLAYWRVASEEINYRRFFDVNELASIRMENPQVFHQFHEFIFRLIKEGAVTGVRIDHVDGLHDPERYLQQFQHWASQELTTPVPPPHSAERPFFMIVEKILSHDEGLPGAWPVFGTTGYEFLNLVNGLFINQGQERAMEQVYHRFIHQTMVLDDLVYETKKQIMRVSMAGEINTLGHQLNRLSERDRSSRDFTLNILTHAIREIIACFPVYRTYVTRDHEVALPQDQTYIDRAVRKAKRRNPAVSGEVFDFVRDLLLHPVNESTATNQEARQLFISKFQQFTSPVTAKGYEDTAFYIYNRLISLNEVGGEPDHFGVSLSQFHQDMQTRAQEWPHSLSGTSTHDTKRSEDVRARINVLSEIPKEWRQEVTQWAKFNKKYKTNIEGRMVPEANEEYFLYQTLIGSWPLESLDDPTYMHYQTRIQSYMEKALKEAKLHTSWVNPNQIYHEAMHHFIEQIFDRTTPNPFLKAFLPFQQWISQVGMYNSLSQVLIKIFAPGIPDFYQGSELWDLTLVDPDNRAPVDYTLRTGYLNELQQGLHQEGQNRLPFIQSLLSSMENGKIKMFVTLAGLQCRQQYQDLVSAGTYIPWEAHGNLQSHVCAFSRTQGQKSLILIVPRLIAGLLHKREHHPIGAEIWENTWITSPNPNSKARYRNIFTDEHLTSDTIEGKLGFYVKDICAHFPVAILEKQP